MILPLYYLADATITLMRRLMRGEPIVQAHRTHFYQRATDNGFTVLGVVTRVFAVNICLGALAMATVIEPGSISDITALHRGGRPRHLATYHLGTGQRMSRVLVTGASGFIGRAVVAALARDGHEVRAAVRRPQLAFGDGVEVVQHADLAQPVAWQPLLTDIEWVVHLAGIAHTGNEVGAATYDLVNRQATAQLATAAAQAGVGRFCIRLLGSRTEWTCCRSCVDRDRPAGADQRLRPLKARRRGGRASLRRAVHDPAAGAALRTRRQRKFRHAWCASPRRHCRCR